MVNAYLENPPSIAYENIIFSDLPENKVVGLITIISSQKICSFSKNIWKYSKGTVFKREGSNSKIQVSEFEFNTLNLEIVQQIEKGSSNNIQHTLDEVIDFINNRHKDLQPHYKVFREQFVLCWAGKPKLIEGKILYSRVDIELINEQVRLFFSALDEVEIHIEENSFHIVEYIKLGADNQLDYYPLEVTNFNFLNNGTYKVEQKLIFSPPTYPREKVLGLWAEIQILVKKIINQNNLTTNELEKVLSLPSDSLICYLSGYLEVRDLLEEIRPMLKKINLKAYDSVKATLRILRKLKYNQ